MKQLNFILVALFAGFVGGIVGTRIGHTRDQSLTGQIIRARTFELVNEKGEAISYWGIDRDNYAVLALGSYFPPGSSRLRGGPGNSPGGIADPRNQRAVLGVVGDSPFLELRGSDGKTRMMANLSIYDKPLIWMADESGKRLSLGVEHSDAPSRDDDNWALVFEPNRASIGMFTVLEGGQKYVKGSLSVSKDGAALPYRPAK